MVAKHDELDTVPSLQMIKALKGCGFVREPGVIYCWSLTSDREGSQYLPPEMSQPPSRDRDWIPERPHLVVPTGLRAKDAYTEAYRKTDWRERQERC